MVHLIFAMKILCAGRALLYKPSKPINGKNRKEKYHHDNEDDYLDYDPDKRAHTGHFRVFRARVFPNEIEDKADEGEEKAENPPPEASRVLNVLRGVLILRRILILRGIRRRLNGPRKPSAVHAYVRVIGDLLTAVTAIHTAPPLKW